MKKYKLIPLLLGSLLAVSSCSLFNDDDMIATNSYNPPVSTPSEEEGGVEAGGVKATTNENVPGAYVFKNVCYATNETIKNTYATGEKNHNVYNVNSGQDYYANKASNNYDLYVPEEAPRNSEHTIILFVHGGAWVSGFKTDVNPYVFEFANKGFITATIKYTLLKKTMDDPSLSIFRNLDEIDACIASIKSVLKELGFNTDKAKLAICGFSSGSHLSMLYSYSRGKDSPIPLKFVIDCVGPVDIQPESWKAFYNMDEEAYEHALDEGLSYAKIHALEEGGHLTQLGIAGDEKYWTKYQTMRIANGMCGIPFSLETVASALIDPEDEETLDNENEAVISMLEPANGGEAQLSVTHWISEENNFPIICAYAGKDSVVGIGQFARLEKALLDNHVTYESFYFRDSGHTDITKENNPSEYERFVNKVVGWAKGTIE